MLKTDRVIEQALGGHRLWESNFSNTVLQGDLTSDAIASNHTLVISFAVILLSGLEVIGPHGKAIGAKR